MRSFGIVRAVSSQFFGQLIGVLLALGISVVLAYKVGAGIESDIFFLGRRLVTGLTEALNKALVVVYIPFFIHAMIEGKDNAFKVLNKALLKMLLLGIVLTAIFIMLSPVIISLLAPGIGSDAQDAANNILVIFLLMLPATILVVVFNGFCNAVGSFGYPALARLFPRLFLFATLLLFVPPLGIEAISWSFTLGNYAALIIVAVVAYSAMSNVATTVDTLPGQDQSDVTRRRGLAMLAILVASQVAIWLETSYAIKGGEGALSMLEYAQRLGNLIPGMLSFSLVAVFYTAWCREIARGERETVARRFYHWLAIGLAVVLPVAAYIYVNAHELVVVLLRHGSFSDANAQLTFNLIRLMIPAVIGVFMINLLLARILADDRLPVLRLVVIYSAFEVIVKWIMLHFASSIAGLEGVAMAIGLSPTVLMVLLFIYMIASGIIVTHIPDQALFYKLCVIPLIACIAFYSCSLVYSLFWSPGDSIILLAILLGVSGILGLLLTLCYTYLVGLTPGKIRSLIKVD